MWNPRLYATIVCVGLIARSSQRGALNQLDGELDGWAGLVTFWIPLVALICIFGSVLVPVVVRRVSKRGG